VYGYAVEEEEVELINLRLTTVGVTVKPKIKRLISKKKSVKKATSTRDVFFEHHRRYIECPI